MQERDKMVAEVGEKMLGFADKDIDKKDDD